MSGSLTHSHLVPVRFANEVWTDIGRAWLEELEASFGLRIRGCIRLRRGKYCDGVCRLWPQNSFPAYRLGASNTWLLPVILIGSKSSKPSLFLLL